MVRRVSLNSGLVKGQAGSDVVEPRQVVEMYGSVFVKVLAS